jgi:uncharacterized membrane protein YphA (DoxX/SURF4 family)
MNKTIIKFNKLGNSFGFFGPHAARWLLAVFLFYKGVYFMEHTDMLMQMIPSAYSDMMEMAVFHYVCFGHMMGGVMLFFGLMSRMAAVGQIPILIGATAACIQLGDYTQLLVSITVLFLLIVVAVFGSGKFSADYKLKLYM